MALPMILKALQAARSSEDAEEQLHQLNEATADDDYFPETAVAAAAVRTVLSSMAAFSGADVQLHGCAALHTLLQDKYAAQKVVFRDASQAVFKAMTKHPDHVDVQLWGARALKSMLVTTFCAKADDVRSQAVATVLAAIQQHALAEFEVRGCLIDLLYMLCSECDQGGECSGNTNEASILAVADADVLSTLMDFEFELECHMPHTVAGPRVTRPARLQVPVWHDLLAVRPSAASRLGHAHLWFLCKQLCFNVAFGTREQLLKMLRFATIDSSDDFVGEYGEADDYSRGYEEEGFEEDQLIPEEPDSANSPPNPFQPHCALDSYYTHEEYKAIREDPDTGAMELDAPVHSVDDYEAEEDEDDSVELTAVVSREERDRAGRKRAIDLDEVPAAKRPCPAELETRVAMARSMCSAQSDARFREIFKARQHRGHARLHLSPALLNRRPAPRAQPAFSP